MHNPVAGQNEPGGLDHLPLPYYASTTRAAPPIDELRERIPGWGVDLDYRDRPAVPMEPFDPGSTGAHWTFPERQPEEWPRERSPEHGILPPVFGTSCPPRGVSGAIRRYAYTMGEGKASHWLLLMMADRVDVLEGAVEATLRGRPDNPLTETGIVGEIRGGGVRSRVGQGRADLKHQWLDPLIVAAPWLIGGYAAYRAGSALARTLGGDRETAVQRAARERRAEASSRGRKRAAYAPPQEVEYTPDTGSDYAHGVHDPRSRW